jgi:WS/DGAT/MGAT family acyltransferase
MKQERLSALDSSFLRVESPTAHMHVGWAARFGAPDEGTSPSFEQIRAQVAGRMGLAPRYRQRLARLPFGVGNPVWVDDESFHVDHHVWQCGGSDFGAIVDQVMSTPLQHDRPMWELWVGDRLDDGKLGIVGKAHHCMVDGLAAVEIATLLLDATPQAHPVGQELWRPRRRPSQMSMLAELVRGGMSEALGLALAPTRAIRSPLESLARLRSEAARASRALGHLLEPAASSSFNQPISPDRHLATLSRPLDDLKQISRRHGATVNDVVLAASAGALRRLSAEREEMPCELKTMVPVNVRPRSGNGLLGNGISFVFIDLPCSEPSALRRLQAVQLRMGQRKLSGEPEGGASILRAIEHTPPPIQAAVSRMAATSRAFNLTISNIPGPSEQLYMLGCPLEEAYPVVPIADNHGLSIGMTSIGKRAFFGIYADRATVPDADRLAQLMDSAIDELAEQHSPSPRSRFNGPAQPVGTGAV